MKESNTEKEYIIPCELIQDLLPLYVDGLTSGETDRRIEAHLQTCGECSRIYQQMKADITNKNAVWQEESRREIDYLKTVRRRGWRKMLLAGAAALVLVLAAVSVKLFVIGQPRDNYYLTYSNVNGDQLSVGGVFYDSAAVYSRYRLKPRADGTTDLVVYACLPSVFNRNGTFNLDINLSDVENAVNINGVTVKKDGTTITRLANDLYLAKNPYIGNASADGKLAQTLRIAWKLGNFKNELQTSSQPYGWTLNFEDGVSNSAVFEERIRDYACVLMALTGNLGEVGWTYTVELESGPVLRRGSISEEECSERAGGPIKGFSESPEKVQELLDILGVEE